MCDITKFSSCCPGINWLATAGGEFNVFVFAGLIHIYGRCICKINLCLLAGEPISFIRNNM